MEKVDPEVCGRSISIRLYDMLNGANMERDVYTINREEHRLSLHVHQNLVRTQLGRIVFGAPIVIFSRMGSKQKSRCHSEVLPHLEKKTSRGSISSM